MWTESTEGKEYIKEISREIIDEIDPEELDLFDELSLEYFDNPTPPIEASTRDDPLGFGMNEILVATTPATLAMVKAVLSYLIVEVLNLADEESREAFKKKIKSLFTQQREHNKGKDVPPLSAEQLKIIHRLALKQAIDFGISKQKAENLAKALVGRLSLNS